jgi:predicted nucleic acid-binding protein
MVPAGVSEWSRAHDVTTCLISVLTIGELKQGIEMLPEGRRRSKMEAWLARDVIQLFADSTLEVTMEIAEAWGTFAARALREHRHISAPDGLILATARVHHLTVVTRNVRDFSGYDVPIVNPWEPAKE